MRSIAFTDIVSSVESMCIRACRELPGDVVSALSSAVTVEHSPLGRSILEQCLRNAETASADRIPICQDTGFAVFFVEIGADLRIDGGLVGNAIAEGTRGAYVNGALRASIVADPLFDRRNTGDNTPPVVHVDIVDGDRLKIFFAPKGGGCENMSYLRMLTPSEGVEGVTRFVVESVVGSGATRLRAWTASMAPVLTNKP